MDLNASKQWSVQHTALMRCLHTFLDVSSVRLKTARKLAKLYSYMFEIAARLANTKNRTAPRSAAGLYLARTSSI